MQFSLDRVDKRIEELRDFTVKTLCDLISYPTVNPPGDKYREITEYLTSVLKELGLDVRVFEVPKHIVAKYYPDYADYPRYNIIARVSKGSGPVIHFNGHYDVVPAGSGWTMNPYKPVVRDGRVYGRGASDMKGGIATIITMAKAIVESDIEFNGTIELSFTPDEETGGQTGVGYIVEQGIVKPDYAIVAEPSSLNMIWIGNKGAVWLLVEVFGKQAHGSTPWRGINAFEMMVKLAYRIIYELKPKIELKKSKYEYDEPEGAKATITIGGEVRGGAKVNIVPGYYAFTIDRRVIPEETVDEAEREILNFIDKVRRDIPELNVKTRVLAKFDATVTDPTTPLVQTAIKSAEEVLKTKPRVTVCIGGLDTRYFQTRGIQAITYGPGIPAVAHTSDEYIHIDDMVAMAKIYSRIVLSLLAK
ncbi:MAG TPA: ArgE/DapE family deacylase [Desulfurococcales archaeon]|nr:ArgE/DapE family deacylase [Desulfurococcales archaeon]